MGGPTRALVASMGSPVTGWEAVLWPCPLGRSHAAFPDLPACRPLLSTSESCRASCATLSWILGVPSTVPRASLCQRGVCRTGSGSLEFRLGSSCLVTGEAADTRVLELLLGNGSRSLNRPLSSSLLPCFL